MPRKKGTKADVTAEKAGQEATPMLEDVASDATADEMIAGHFDRDTLSKEWDTASLLSLAKDMELTVPNPEDREALLDMICAEEVQAPADPSAVDDAQLPEASEEAFTPYDAIVSSGLLVFRYKPDGPVIGTLQGGSKVRVTERAGEYALLENGIYVKEALLTPLQ